MQITERAVQVASYFPPEKGFVIAGEGKKPRREPAPRKRIHKQTRLRALAAPVNAFKDYKHTHFFLADPAFAGTDDVQQMRGS